MERIEDTTVLLKKLTRIFGYEGFKSEDQRSATTEVFAGKTDVYVNLYPGAGKSICFQLPAILKENSLTIVFVPTNNLGKNQVDFLKRKNISAEYLCAATLRNLSKKEYENMKSDVSKLKLVYASTDKRTRNFVEDLLADSDVQNNATCVVFDEAQCICPLSHDYSQSYRDLAKSFKRLFADVRKIAVTGSATIEVKNDIIHELGMKNPVTFSTSWLWILNRDVCFIDILLEPYNDLKDFINDNIGPLTKETFENPRECGIIFCRKKEAVRKIERELKKLEIPVVSFHGDMSLKDRTSVHERWIAGKIAVLATTKAFGIGIHGPNVRFVVHWSMPTSIQQLFQQVGRCVQDERKSSCRIYFSMEEEYDISRHIKSLRNMPDEDTDIVAKKHEIFNEFIDYCLQTKSCRFVAQMAYFGKTVTPCKFHCDVCQDYYGLKRRTAQFLKFQNLTKQTMILNLAQKRTQQSQSFSTRIDNEKSAGKKEVEVYGLSSKRRQRFYNCLYRHLHNNYQKAKRNAERANDINEDISEIARQLEYSVFLGANCRGKYKHDIAQTIDAIKKSNVCNSICAYIKHYRESEMSLSHEKPEIIELDDDDDDYEQPAKKCAIAKDEIETIDLINESDSGSKTP